MSSLRHNPFTVSSPGAQVLAPALARDAIAAAERREFGRWLAESDVWLLDLEGLTVLRCKADNLSEGGVQCTVPIGYGLAVGQRYELRVIHRQVSDPTRKAFWSGCYGTIIRTRLVTEGQKHQLSVALRFDTPQPFSGAEEFAQA
ncbi:MAG: hypothetical protein U1A27_02880 [Phycisphaerae bacterium]